KDEKINDLEKGIKDFRDRAVAAEINFKSENQRNVLLLDQVEKMSKENERLRASRTVGGAGVVPAGGTAANGGTAATSSLSRRPPAEDLKGSVLETDPTSGLVTISLGSDAGLQVGHTLEVYRTEPKPEYVGTIRIVDTNF